ncbi:hypothetical protein [Anaeromyxobacter oryzae]|uniref:Uncharacterized protein n=1 Tax=Anaeromyxobacter oryzae TaxID=2918170 RepID=A0ABN6MS85_9BACT|nr:hypothetical protein [Anaeromyxobacter oryzae]BDG03801.1 hypothetical protein AMOR_27970 [Anaeromyxobacter oryzae]
MPSKPLRVVVLLTALGVAAVFALGTRAARRTRTTWERPVDVGVFVLGAPPRDGVDALAGALAAVAARLADDRARLAGGGGAALRFEVLGPATPARLPPTAAPAPSILARAAHALDLWRAERAVHAALPEVDPGAFDVRVYVVLDPAAAPFAEGIGAAGGEVGVVRAAIAGDALLAATAVVHEALHALGATDKYDRAGHAVAPGGLWAPDQVPPYPQPRAEIMVGEIPLGPGRGRLPASAAEVGIGPETAREIGWLGAAAEDGPR